ncbi:hypothetical protein CHU92_05390 [Flavobacterium cyanobacteriorum]|uniref:Esterase n=1 Tax=Flavobacterium cyanobacteriorum TaxID=2022802 RepID=A0A255ZCQ4_9FLAO|nr:alpha/beta fold hydrolase [Flavobacterium cyanobacteriorum]OYQ38380.1 hypothetical protein CHU92_05390 [Flavobacterium cyanobacteriorum]
MNKLLFFTAIMLTTALHSQGKLVKIDNFESKYVKARNVEIWLPDEYFTDNKQKFPVLYMHDGQNVFNPETAMGNIAWEADNTAQKLIKDKKIKPVIIVASWCTDRRFFEYYPEKAAKNLSGEDKAAMEKVRIQMGVVQSDYMADEYLKFLTTELKPYIDKNYRTLTDAANTAICGSSMGGLISLYAICEYPRIFGKAACVSTHWPILFDNSNMNFSEAIRKYVAENLPSPKNHSIYFDFGTETLDELYEIHQVKVDDIMKDKGYTKGKNWVTRKFEGAAHNEKSWQQRMDVILEFLFKQ